ncbi:hypothetical protein PENTCL1PPCAC_13189, partial [Pristionchus entomophagus]
EDTIPHSDLEKELELMQKNTHLEFVSYNVIFQSPLIGRRYVDVMRFIEAKHIAISEHSLNDCDLKSVVQIKEEVEIDYGSAVTPNGIAWVYEKMRDPQLELECCQFFMKNVEDVWTLLEKFGNFNRETLVFTTSNPNQIVTIPTMNIVAIDEGNLQIIVKGIEADEDTELIQWN